MTGLGNSCLFVWGAAFLWSSSLPGDLTPRLGPASLSTCGVDKLGGPGRWMCVWGGQGGRGAVGVLSPRSHTQRPELVFLGRAWGAAHESGAFGLVSTHTGECRQRGSLPCAFVMASFVRELRNPGPSAPHFFCLCKCGPLPFWRLEIAVPYKFVTREGVLRTAT